ncbi:MAG: Na/Pi cotransporter family protein [Comamonas sp.]
MKHLLDLLAAIALLVWGTYLVRTGVLRTFGGSLRQFLARSLGNRFTAALSGIAVTALVQSSTATALITSSFVGQGLIALPAAMAVMLGANVGTAAMAVLFSFDLSWLSPLFIFVGVVLFITRQHTRVGDAGRMLIGLGLMLLALRLVTESTTLLTQAPAVQLILESLSSDVLMEILLGALLAVMSYSSLAVVLLVATLALQVISTDIALGLVLGANLGSGLQPWLTSAKSSVSARQVPLGALLAKLAGVALAAPLIGPWLTLARQFSADPATLVVMYHLSFNIMLAVLFIGFTRPLARATERLLPRPRPGASPLERLNHLDASALATPALAISCAAREALHLADTVETMLRGVLTVLKTDNRQLAESLRKMDDDVDTTYSGIKYYMTQISRQALSQAEGQRWTDIISFTINMEQIGDIIERVLQDIEDKKIRRGRDFSPAGRTEIEELHARLVANLRLGMSVFLNGNVRDAQRLLEEKVRFRDLERAYASSHLDRLSEKTMPSIETSSLHIDLISEFKRINSHICSIAYPILDSAGALAPSRLKSDQ